MWISYPKRALDRAVKPKKKTAPPRGLQGSFQRLGSDTLCQRFIGSHHIDLDEVEILDREPRWFERGVKEEIYIK